MKKIGTIFLFLILLINPVMSFALPLGYSLTEKNERERDWMNKAAQGTLDCKDEIAKREKDVIERHDIVEDIPYWRIYGTASCVSAMLKAKKFTEAEAFIEKSWQGVKLCNDWPDEKCPGNIVYRWSEIVLKKLHEIPSIVTNKKCETGQQAYQGDEFDKLYRVINQHVLHGKWQWGDVSYFLLPKKNCCDSFILGIEAEASKHPSCLTKTKLIEVLNSLLDYGYQTKDISGARLGQFQDFLRLGDEALVKRVLDSGIGVERNDWVYLFARAPTMRMVNLLKEHGFKLTKKEYSKVLKIIADEKDFGERAQKMDVGGIFNYQIEPEVIQYYQRKSN
jgi:hypothetical protein